MNNNALDHYYNMADILTVSQVLDIVIRLSEEGTTRSELARLTGFSKSTISNHVETLLAENLVLEGSGFSRGRKNSHCIYFNADCGCVISVDVGVTSLNVAVCNLVGKPLAASFQEDVDVNLGPHIILNQAITTAQNLLNHNHIPMTKVFGIGVGIPAPIEFATGRPSQPPLMHGGWGNYPIKETFEEAFGKPAFVDNDVNIMAMAEYEAENTHNDGNFLFVKLGTGIGCGIFCGGKIYRGASGCAGDIGHISIEGNDDLCACGNRGCLENLAGGAAIQKRIQWMAQNGKSDFLASCLAKNEPITCRTLGAGILAQDVACKEFVYQTGLYIGEVMAKLVNFYNPSMVVFGGGLINLGDLLFTGIREKIYRCSTALATRNLQIKCSSLGEQAGIKGAAIMVRDRIFMPSQFSKNYLLFREEARPNTLV